MDIIAPTMVLSAAGTLIGKYFQKRAEEIARRRNERQSELENTTKFTSEISQQMDEYLYRTRDIYDGFKHEVDKKEIEERWKAFITVKSEWNSTLNLKISRILHFFGSDMRTLFSEGICKNFVNLRKGLDQLYYHDQKKQKSIFSHLLIDDSGETVFIRTWNSLAELIQEFNSEMMRLITIENVGVLRKYVSQYQQGLKGV